MNTPATSAIDEIVNLLNARGTQLTQFEVDIIIAALNSVSNNIKLKELRFRLMTMK